MLKVLKKVRKVKLSLAQKNNYQNLYTVLCTVDLMNVFKKYTILYNFFFIFEKIIHFLQNSKNVYQILISCFAKLRRFSVFSVFFASYHFVSHTKYSVSLQDETSETNPFLHYFASLIFASVSLRFASKRNVGTPYECPVPLAFSAV